MENNLHRLLKRQLKTFNLTDDLTSNNNVNYINLLNAISYTYYDYDKEIKSVENILDQTSQELFSKNIKLAESYQNLEQIVENRTRDLQSISNTLQKAELITNIASFGYYLVTSEFRCSKNLNNLLNHNSEFKNFTDLHLLFLNNYNIDLLNTLLIEIENKRTHFKKEFTNSNINKFYLLEIEIIYNENELPIELIGAVLDITEKKLHEEFLTNSLIEKESLIAEIHHRVKNNLTLILSFMEMQEMISVNHETKYALISIGNRIRSMSLVYEQLFKSQNFNLINLQNYIQDITNRLILIYGCKDCINFKLDIEPVNVNAKMAIPIGQIINESVSNSIKHSIKNNPNPIIEIKLNHVNDTIYIEINDNGNEEVLISDLEKSNTLGYKLITIFIKQLKGSYTIDYSNGLKIKLNFKNNI